MSATHFRIGVMMSAGDWLPFLADIAFKSFIILASVCLAAALLRRASAATRHLLWLLAMINLLCLPFFVTLLPGWAALPRWMDVHALFAPQLSSVCPPEPRQAQSRRDASLAALAPFAQHKPSTVSAASDIAGAGGSSVNLRSCMLIAWVAGMVFPLLTAILGAASLWRLGKRSRALLDPEWTALLAELTAALRLRRRVTLLVSGQRQMPMTWGLFHPRILLPHEALDWPASRRRNVLLHELAHVKRCDCLAHLLTRLACAIYWFNPLVWVAAHKLAAERERACDDQVLCAGAKAPEYAEQLLEVTARLAARGMAVRAAIAMARPSALEARLVAILDENRNRHPVSGLPALAATLVLFSLLTPLAMLQAAVAPPALLSSEPRIQFATTSLDFGRATSGDVVKCEFVFTNVGGRVLEITNVQPSCGCTAAGAWSRQVEPGKTGAIPLQFNSAGYGGPVLKSILVSCNDPAQPAVTLLLKGQIWRPFEITPPLALLSLTTESPSNAVAVRIINNLDQPAAVFGAESKNPVFAVELKTNQPGKEYQALIKTVPPYPTNREQGQVTIKTTSKEMPVINLAVYANVRQQVASLPIGANGITFPAPETNKQLWKVIWNQSPSSRSSAPKPREQP